MVKVRTKIVFDIDDLAIEHAKQIVEDYIALKTDDEYHEMVDEVSQILISFFDKAVMTGET